MAEQYTAYMIADRLVEDIAGLKVEISDYSPKCAGAMRNLGRATLAESDTAPQRPALTHQPHRNET